MGPGTGGFISLRQVHLDIWSPKIKTKQAGAELGHGKIKVEVIIEA